MTIDGRRGVRAFAASLLTGAVLAGSARALDAHRLDEYLQATLVSIERDRVGLELTLTPGVSIAPQLVPSIDADGDRTLSSEEQQAYARTVIDALSVDVDGAPRPLTLLDARFSTGEDMYAGTGTIRLRVDAAMPAVSAGTHEIRYRNAHRADFGVYLANALVPRDAAVTIERQDRDVLQHELRIRFRVAGTQAARAAALTAAAALLVAGAAMYVRQRVRERRV